MNILIKLTSLVGLTIAPLISMNGGHGDTSSMDCCNGNKTHAECGMHENNHMKIEKVVMLKDGEKTEYCMIDSATCAGWLASGSIDSSACAAVENGMCRVESAACDKMMKRKHGQLNQGKHKGCAMMANGAECDEACILACKAQGITCDMSEKECCMP
jgi:hypothetical protein